jgi:putative colanic acid biosynthesis acetyltransferase WcaF
MTIGAVDDTETDRKVSAMGESLLKKTEPSDYPSPHSRANQLMRILWRTVWLLAYRPSPKIFHGWRRLLLRTFGAKIAKNAYPHSSVKIWAPWNLEMGPLSCLGPDVDCYCVDRVVLGARATVSQYSFLCTATHDYHDPLMPLVTAPIVIGERAWVAADVFIGPGVTIGDGAVVGARSSVYRNVEPRTVVAGNPVRILKNHTCPDDWVHR